MPVGISGSLLADRALSKVGCGYAYGAIGHVLSLEKLRRFKELYPKMYTDDYFSKTQRWIGKQCFDCSGLIKFFVWGNTSALSYYYGSLDYNADSAFLKSVEKGNISRFPDVRGICVRFSGHVGIYVGGGFVVEARGVNFGVVKTKLQDRPWSHWFCWPNVSVDLFASSPTSGVSVCPKCGFSF